MFDKIKGWFKKETVKGPWYEGASEQPDIVQPEPKAAPKKKRSGPKVQVPHEDSSLSTKELATQNNEPYINIVKISLDPNNINNGEFELDWNTKFVLNLVRAGYKIKEEDTEAEIVDRWFQTVCRNVALEVYEQDQADPTNRDMTTDMRIIKARDLGNGRTEVS